MDSLLASAFNGLMAGLFLVTGEAVLWALSLGRRRPRWATYRKLRAGEMIITAEPVFYVGGAFWGAVIALAWILLR